MIWHLDADVSSAQLQTLAEFTCSTCSAATHHASSQRSRPLPCGPKWALRVAGLVSVGYLDQTNYRRDGAHQADQPAGEFSCP